MSKWIVYFMFCFVAFLSVALADTKKNDPEVFIETYQPPRGENKSWYSKDANIEADSELFAGKIKDEIKQSQNQIKKLKQEMRVRGVTKAKREKISDAENKLTRVQSKYRRLNASSPETAEESRAQLEGALSEMEKTLEQSSKLILSEKEVFQWRAQEKLNDRAYQLKQLKKAAEKADPGTRLDLETEIAKLEKHSRQVEAKIKETKSAKRATWKITQQQVQEDLKDYDRQYLEALGTAKKL